MTLFTTTVMMWCSEITILEVSLYFIYICLRLKCYLDIKVERQDVSREGLSHVVWLLSSLGRFLRCFILVPSGGFAQCTALTAFFSLHTYILLCVEMDDNGCITVHCKDLWFPLVRCKCMLWISKFLRLLYYNYGLAVPKRWFVSVHSSGQWFCNISPTWGD